MLNENAKKWVAALRSGEYKQAQSQLKTEIGHCCLGVACELAKQAGVISDYKSSEWFLPVTVRNWLGLATHGGTYQESEDTDLDMSLARKNDRGATFSEIADIIESEPEGLFSK
jgi:hypothetical protein